MLDAGLTTATSPQTKNTHSSDPAPTQNHCLPNQPKEQGPKEKGLVPQSASKHRQGGRSDCRYKLQAVIHHIGSGAGRGHYPTDVLCTKQGGGCEWEHHD